MQKTNLQTMSPCATKYMNTSICKELCEVARSLAAFQILCLYVILDLKQLNLLFHPAVRQRESSRQNQMKPAFQQDLEPQ